VKSLANRAGASVQSGYYLVVDGIYDSPSVRAISSPSIYIAADNLIAAAAAWCCSIYETPAVTWYSLESLELALNSHFAA
jgi:predicted kinase